VIHVLFTSEPGLVTARSRRSRHPRAMADFLAVLGTVLFVVVMLGLVWALERV
jgi:hypothetical protein